MSKMTIVCTALPFLLIAASAADAAAWAGWGAESVRDTRETHSDGAGDLRTPGYDMLVLPLDGLGGDMQGGVEHQDFMTGLPYGRGTATNPVRHEGFGDMADGRALERDETLEEDHELVEREADEQRAKLPSSFVLRAVGAGLLIVMCLFVMGSLSGVLQVLLSVLLVNKAMELVADG